MQTQNLHVNRLSRQEAYMEDKSPNHCNWSFFKDVVLRPPTFVFRFTLSQTFD